MKILSLSARIMVIAGALSLVTVGVALASSYEFIKSVQFPSTTYSGNYATTTWDVRTTGTFYEYRSLYYSTTNSPYNWIEWTTCRREGNVDTEIQDTCIPTLPTVGTPTTLYVRASTNYSGCGTWTPTPDESSCGGTFTTTTIVTP